MKTKKYIVMLGWFIFVVGVYWIFSQSTGTLVDTQLSLNTVNGSNLDFAAREGAKRATFLYPIVAAFIWVLGTWGIARFWRA